MKLKFSLSKKLSLITALVAVVALSSLTGNMIAQKHYVSITEQSEIIGKASRYQALADAYHDGSKGALYRIFYNLNFNKEGVSDARADLKQQIANLKLRVDQLNELALPDHIKAKVTTLNFPFIKYVNEIDDIADTAITDFKKVAGKLPAFETTFATLGAAQDMVGDAISAEAESLTEQSHSLSKMAQLGSFASILVMMVLFISLFNFLRNSVAKPLSTIAQHIKNISTGTLVTPISADGRKDEIGVVLEALEEFREQSFKTQLLQQEADTLADDDRNRRNRVDAAIIEFKTVISSTKKNLAGGILGLLQASDDLSTTASNADQSTRTSSASSEQNTVIVRQIAHATHEMQISIKEVASQIKIAASAVEATSQLAESSSFNVTQLSTSAQTIDSIIDVIRAIASQTNLLALNATIESARAGEAGRGFAVVASEVKVLAGQTAQATNAIAEQISAVKDSVSATVEAIAKMVEAFTQVDGAVASISGALHQQTSAAGEIARSAETAASSVKDMNNIISEVLSLVENTNGSAKMICDVSRTLNTQSDELSSSVDSFLKQVKAA